MLMMLSILSTQLQQCLQLKAEAIASNGCGCANDVTSWLEYALEQQLLMAGSSTTNFNDPSSLLG